MTTFKVTDEVKMQLNNSVVICTYKDLQGNEFDGISDTTLANQYSLEEVEVKIHEYLI